MKKENIEFFFSNREKVYIIYNKIELIKLLK